MADDSPYVPDLSSQLPAGFHELADGLMVDRYGDPHVAFAVLVFPDREPEVVVVSEAGECPLRKIVGGKSDGQPTGDGPRFFMPDDLDAASAALSDASSELGSRYIRKEWADLPLGERIAAGVAQGWRHRRDIAANRLMKAAALESARPEVCPHCGGRFTTKGLPMHLSRSAWCSKVEAKARAAGEAD